MRTLLFIIFFTISCSFFAQVSTSKTEPVKENTTNFYIGAGRNNSFRNLQMNDEPYGKPLGNHENETKLKIWSYEIGMRSQVHKYFQVDGGVALERFGEQYSKTGPVTSGSDTTFSYFNRYTYISVPLQVYVTAGDEFKVYAGGGISPGISYAYKQEINRIDSLGSNTTAKTNQPDKLNSFNLAARMSAGLQWQWNSNLGIYVNYTYLLGLTSTYNEQNPFKHYSRYGCLRFGISYHMK